MLSFLELHQLEYVNCLIHSTLGELCVYPTVVSTMKTPLWRLLSLLSQPNSHTAVMNGWEEGGSRRENRKKI